MQDPLHAPPPAAVEARFLQERFVPGYYNPVLWQRVSATEAAMWTAVGIWVPALTRVPAELQSGTSVRSVSGATQVLLLLLLLLFCCG